MCIFHDWFAFAFGEHGEQRCVFTAQCIILSVRRDTIENKLDAAQIGQP